MWSSPSFAENRNASDQDAAPPNACAAAVIDLPRMRLCYHFALVSMSFPSEAMPLSAAEPLTRIRKHTRSVRFEGYARSDGLWDIEAHLLDIKPDDYLLAPGVRPAGSPVHDMWIRVTIDRKMNVIAAEACTDAMPYPPHCAAIFPDYAGLAGLNLMRGFRKALYERFGAVRGCTHLTELLGQLPSAAIQVFAGEQRDNHDDGRKPFQLDRCHALDTSGEAVRLYYPRWQLKTGTD
jgi:hypothetical protein